MRTVIKYWDVGDKVFRTVTGVVDGERLSFYANETLLLNVYLVKEGVVAYDGFTAPVTELFAAVVDNDYAHDDSPLVPSVDVLVNEPGDWSGGTADPTAGEFSLRINGAAASLLSAIEGLASLTASIELTARMADDTLVFVIRMPVTVNNLMGG